jgi:long-chain acyl-CoA synthetase
MSTIAEPAPAMADGAPGTASTLPGLLLAQASARPRATAIRVKHLGRWQETSWAEYAERVAGIGRALMHMGVSAGDHVAIVSDNRAEWPMIDLAVQGIGAATVAVYNTSPAGELAALLKHAAVEVAVVEDEEQLDKLIEVQSQLSLRHIFVIDPRGIRRLDDPASGFEALEALGNRQAVEMREGDLQSWAKSVEALDPTTVATVIFTPATAGTPKGAVLSHRALVAAATAGAAALGLRAGDEIVSSLPLSDIAERTLTVGQAVHAGAVVNFGEGGESLFSELSEVQPTVVLGTPRVWERLREVVEAGSRGADPLKRVALRSARRPGRGLSDFLVKRPLRNDLGLGRARIALSGTAPCSAELIEWWRAVGVPLRQVYGLAETAGLVTIANVDDAPASVGRAVNGIEVRLSDDDEVLVRGPVVFDGYLDDAEATRAALDDGWLRTGDLGALDDGVLSIAGRAKDVVITSNGHRAAPRAIEARLEKSRFVGLAIVVGDERPCLGALVEIDAQSVGEWAAQRGSAFTTFRTLAALPEVRDLIAEEIEAAGTELDEGDRLGCFALLPEPLAGDEELVTPTQKVRRSAVLERFRDEVEQMYAERSAKGTAP